MPDEPLPSEPTSPSEPVAEGEGAVLTLSGVEAPEPEAEDDAPKPLNQEVDITEAGPCRKHIKVRIPAEDIRSRLDEKFSEMVGEANVPGYRPGKAPRKLVEKRFYKDVAEQLKAELLMQSLEQLAEKYSINPLTQPNIDPFKIELPKDAALEYEFDVEVAPEFELPTYKGLKLKRPVRQFNEQDIDKAQTRVLSRHGTLELKAGPAELDDYVIADVVTHDGDKEISNSPGLTIKLQPQLAFRDGLAKDFGASLQGVKSGETRQVDVVVSPNASNPDLRGKTVKSTFAVKEVKTLRLPELTHEFLHQLGVHSVDQLREKIRVGMQRQLEYEQRQSARQQVLAHIAAAADWELPQDLLARQSRKTLARRVMEMQQAGLGEDEIKARSSMLRQDAMASTAKALKEHFVLQKIAEVEKLEVSQDDIDFEIENLANQLEESPRKIRARLEKEELMDTVATDVIERKALDLVLSSAEYEDVAPEQETGMGAIEQQVVPGETVEGGEEEGQG